MDTVEVKITRKAGCEDLPWPQYMSEGASGLDLCAAVEEEITLQPGEFRLIPTGLFVAIPRGYEAQVRPRSGLALKEGIGVLNSPGTVDSDYRGEVGVILINLNQRPFVVKRGMRIAQFVVQAVAKARLKPVKTLEETDRGEGGFGHSGL
jgi:dUTP pyrophosphatase